MPAMTLSMTDFQAVGSMLLYLSLVPLIGWAGQVSFANFAIAASPISGKRAIGEIERAAVGRNRRRGPQSQ